MGDTSNDIEVKSPYLNIDRLNAYRGTWHTHMYSPKPTPEDVFELYKKEVIVFWVLQTMIICI